MDLGEVMGRHEANARGVDYDEAMSRSTRGKLTALIADTAATSIYEVTAEEVADHMLRAMHAYLKTRPRRGPTDAGVS